MSVILLDNKVLGSRRTAIPKLLKPLTKVPHGPSCQQKSQSSELTIATYSGTLKPNLGMRDLRFTTFVKNITGQYIEEWLAENDAEQWFLQSASLQLYYSDLKNQNEIEILALHCEPNELVVKGKVRYKNGPHIHVTAASHPIPKTHFALNISELDTVLASVENLFKAFEVAISMIKEEVLDRINNEISKFESHIKRFP